MDTAAPGTGGSSRRLEATTGGLNHAVQYLKQTLRAEDDEEVDAAVEELASRLSRADADAATDAAEEALATLRSARRFPAMLQLAEATFMAGSASPLVARQYAQALIEEGLLTAALNTLVPLAERAEEEAAEVDGLIGRAYKQRYFDSPQSPMAAESLRRAIDVYLRRYRAAPELNHWHGVNAAGLLARAQRDGVATGTETTCQAISSDVLANLDRGSAVDFWAPASAAEAHVALGDFESATALYSTFARRVDDARQVDDAFSFAAALRQLGQLWGIDANAPPHQRALVDLLEARLLGAKGGSLQVDASRRASQLDDNDQYLQRVFGEDQYQTISWYRAGLEAAKSVVRISAPTERRSGPDSSFPAPSCARTGQGW